MQLLHNTAFLCVFMAISIFNVITSLSLLSIALSFLIILIFISFIVALIKYLNLDKNDKSIGATVAIFSLLWLFASELAEDFISFANIVGYESVANFFSSAENGAASLEDIIKAIKFIFAVSFPVSYFLIDSFAKIESKYNFYKGFEQFLCEIYYKLDLGAKQKKLDESVKRIGKISEEVRKDILNSKKEEILKKHLHIKKRLRKIEKEMDKGKKYLEADCQSQDWEKLKREVDIISKGIEKFLQIPSPSDEAFLELQKTIIHSKQKYLSK